MTLAAAKSPLSFVWCIDMEFPAYWLITIKILLEGSYLAKTSAAGFEPATNGLEIRGSIH